MSMTPRAGLEVAGELAAFIEAEAEKWLPVIRATGATLD